MEISDRKAIIFGGTSGIGLAVARQLAAEGAEVVAVSRNPDRAGDPGSGVRLARCDAREEAAVAALLAAEAPYDILISSATGGERAVGPFLTMDMDGYKASFDKLWGYANVVRHGAGRLPRDGCIVLVSGAPARRMRPGQIAIGSVGGAVEAFARGVASELAPVRINTVAPGQIDTPMSPLEGEARRAFYAEATVGNPIPRAGRPEEIAQAVLFAVTNDFITGTTIDVDGGWLIA